MPEEQFDQVGESILGRKCPVESGCARTGAKAKQKVRQSIVFLLSLQFAPGQDAEKALHTGTLATQTKQGGLGTFGLTIRRSYRALGTRKMCLGRHAR